MYHQRRKYCCQKGMSLGMSLSNKGEPWYESLSTYENNELESEQFLCMSCLSILGKRLSKFQSYPVGVRYSSQYSILKGSF